MSPTVATLRNQGRRREYFPYLFFGEFFSRKGDNFSMSRFRLTKNDGFQEETDSFLGAVFVLKSVDSLSQKGADTKNALPPVNTVTFPAALRQRGLRVTYRLTPPWDMAPRGSRWDLREPLRTKPVIEYARAESNN